MSQFRLASILGAALVLSQAPAFAQSTSGTPVASVSPSSLSFSAIEVGRPTLPQMVTVTNTGDGQLKVTGTTLSGAAAADFNEFNGCRMPLGKNQRCSISVSFKPSATGSRSATLNISTSDKALSVNLTGTIANNVPKIALSPTSLSFGSVAVGAKSAAQTVKLTNSGTADFNIGPIRSGGEGMFDFDIKSGCGDKLAAGSSCDITVTFNPKSPGDKTGAVVIGGQAVGSPATAKLSGSGTGARIALSPPRLSFAEQATGTASAPQTVKVTNTGNASLNISKISLAGPDAADFSQTNTCSSSIAAGANCTVSVTYKPTDEGPKTAAVTVAGNFGPGPAVIGLFAEGKKPMQGGLWRGTDPISGKAMVGLIAENGATHFVREDGVQYFGPVFLDRGRIMGSLFVGDSDSVDGGARLEGGVVSGKSIKGSLMVAIGRDNLKKGELSLTFDALYGKSSSLDKVAGNYKVAASGAALSISNAGVVYSQSSTTGCVINGAVAVIDARFNAYGVKLEYSGCTGAASRLNKSTAFGLMMLDDSGKTPQIVMNVQNLRPGYAISISADKQ